MTHTLIVGGGAAGAVLAARLSEDPQRTVTLVEAGPAGPTPEQLRNGRALPAALPGHPANWAFEAELAPGRTDIVPRGRILGGSTAINGGYFVRARPGDFARWEAVGGERWGLTHALPLLANLERDLDLGAAPGHGDTGPMPARRPSLTDPLTAAFRAAALELGFTEEPDKNAPGSTPGIGPVPSNIIDGVRVNTAMAYLDGARGRPNLRVIGDSRVTRVRFAGTRAIGVEVVSGSTTGTSEGAGTTAGAAPGTAHSTAHSTIDADEVVLCAGAVCTPHLLMLSGIGPGAHLAVHGIRALVDLPVGTAFSDHPQVSVGWHPRPEWRRSDEIAAFPAAINFDSADRTGQGWPTARTGKKSLARDAGRAGLHPDGDLEILLSTAPIGELLTGVPGALPWPGADEWRLLVALQQPAGRGRLGLRSADPLAPPRIEYRHLQEPGDRARMRIGVRTAASVLQSAAFSSVFGRFSSLHEAVLADDAGLDAWMHDHLGTAIHLSGSAPVGPVCDAEGRVHGVTGLRIADTSLLPVVPSRGPFNTAVFIGELIADAMR